MPKKECPSCAMEIAEDSETCPICGYEFSNVGQTRKGLVFFLFILLLIISLVTWYRNVSQ